MNTEQENSNLSTKPETLKIDIQEDTKFNWKLALSWNSFTGYLILFALILVVILPFLGSALSDYSWSQRKPLPDTIIQPEIVPLTVIIESDSVTRESDKKVNDRTLVALTEAYELAEEFATNDLDNWVRELEGRVDNDFLNWYFDYFNQKRREILALVRGVTGQNISQKEFQDFNQEFGSRVVSPEDIELRLEILTSEVTNLYANELNKKLTYAQKDLKLSSQKWEKYLASISNQVAKRDPISGSALAGVSLTGGYVLADALLSGTISAFFEGQAVRLLEPLIVGLGPEAVSILGLGAGGAIKFAGKFAGPVIGGLMIAYDVGSYAHKVNQEKPVLRERIVADLQILKRSALADATVRIKQLDSSLRKSINSISIHELA